MECIWNYSETTGSFTNFNADIADDDNFKSFKYKTKILGNAAA